MRRPWTFDPPPRRCRMGWHRWEYVGTGKRCIRGNCLASRSMAGLPPRGHVDIPEDTVVGYQVTCWDPNGVMLYDGPVPIPEGVDDRMADDIIHRRFNTYRVLAIRGDDVKA